MPFPWTRCSTDLKRQAPDENDAENNESLSHKSKQVKTVRSYGGGAATEPWYSHMVGPCQWLDGITFDAPKRGVSAGSVLKHAQRVLDGMFKKQNPCIYKIGFTHSPAWRWTNKLYGYQHAKDGWTNMIVLFVTDEPFSPAMLEAALIEKHFGNLVQHGFRKTFIYLTGVWGYVGYSCWF